MRTLPSDGTYRAIISATPVIYETEEGALCAAIPVSISGDVAWSGKATVVIGKKDGTLNTRAIDNLKKIFTGWNGQDPFELPEIYQTNADTEGAEPFMAEIVGVNEDYQPKDGGDPVRVFKVQWLNAVGDSTRMPESADRKSVMTKWSSKFKAHSASTGGSKPATKKTEPKAEKPAAASAAAPAKAAAGGPPSRKNNATTASARTSTGEEVWAAMKEANPDDTDEALGAKYWGTIEELFPGREDLNATEWGKVANKLEI